MELSDIAILLVRLWIGLVMVRHGVNHGRNIEGTARWFAKVGFRRPGLNARLSSVGEVLIGLSIASGFLTPFGMAGMAAIMFVAFWTIHRFAGFFVFHRPDEGYEYVTTLLVVGLAVAVLGPGSLSVDHLLQLSDGLNGWVGGGIVVAGVIAGYLQTLAFWEQPAKEKN